MVRVAGTTLVDFISVIPQAFGLVLNVLLLRCSRATEEKILFIFLFSSRYTSWLA